MSIKKGNHAMLNPNTHTHDGLYTCNCKNDGTIFRDVPLLDEINLDIESLKLIKDIATTMLKNKPIREEYLSHIDHLISRLNHELHELREKSL